MESPVKGDFRLARREATVGGIDIPAGGTLMVLYGAANRDPRRFEDPADFRVERDSAEHLAFGRGVHSCPGGSLARLETLGQPRAAAGADDGHPHLGVPPWAARGSSVPVRADLHLGGLTRLHLEFTASERAAG